MSGALHALALGAWPWPLLAWIALVPLLYVVAAASPAGVVCAALAYTATLLGIAVAPWFIATLGRYFQLSPPLAWGTGIGAVAVTALAYGALLALALVRRRRVAGRLGAAWCAALWAVWEPLRTAVLPPYFPLAVLATSQAAVAPVLQVASVTGVAGVTALLVGVNAALAQLVRVTVPRRRRIVGAVVAMLVAGAAALWGAARLRTAAEVRGDAPRILIVDGAAATPAESTLERYIAATVRSAAARPDLVVWPESAVAIDLESNPEAWRRMRTFVDGLEAPVLTGGVGTGLADGGGLVEFNSVHLLRPRHAMLSYHKRLLVPFAESWPALLGDPPRAIEPVAAGDTIAVFGDGDLRFGPLICFEITYAAAVRALVVRGARFVVSVNNDVWFAGWEAPQAVWARVRAVEAGLPVVRATNGGTSAVIDPYGRVLASVRADGAPAWLAAAVPDPVDTIYARTGDIFLLGCLVLVLAGLVRVPRRLTASRSDSA